MAAQINPSLHHRRVGKGERNALSRAALSPSAIPSTKGSSPRADQPWQSAAHAPHFTRRVCTVFSSTRSPSIGALAARSALHAGRRPWVRDFAPDHAASAGGGGAPGRADRRDSIARLPVQQWVCFWQAAAQHSQRARALTRPTEGHNVRDSMCRAVARAPHPGRDHHVPTQQCTPHSTLDTSTRLSPSSLAAPRTTTLRQPNSYICIYIDQDKIIAFIRIIC